MLDRLSDYSDESLLRELRRVSAAVGRTSLTLGDIQNHARCSYEVLKQRFGGLRRALKAAGLETNDFHRNLTDDELLEELARIWDLVLTHEGRRPYKRDLGKFNAKFSEGPYYRRWGSWIRACEALLEWEPRKASETAGPPNAAARQRRSEQGQKRPIPLRIRYAILLRDRFRCQICGRSPSSSPGMEVDVDHITSEAEGGTLDPSNLRCLCKDCNLGKGKYSEGRTVLTT